MTTIGVPEEERAESQEVAISVQMEPENGVRGLGDEIEGTVNYYEVAVGIEQLAGVGERKLLETLAEEVLAYLLETYPLKKARVEIEKFILPNAKAVSVVVEGVS